MPAHNRIPPSLPADHTPASTAPERPFGGGHLSRIDIGRFCKKVRKERNPGRGAPGAECDGRTVMKDEFTFLEAIALTFAAGLIAALMIVGS